MDRKLVLITLGCRDCEPGNTCGFETGNICYHERVEPKLDQGAYDVKLTNYDNPEINWFNHEVYPNRDTIEYVFIEPSPLLELIYD